METAKRITAIFLCFVMLLGIGITSASALEIGDTVEFECLSEDPYGGSNYSKTWKYSGIAKEGINTFESSESEFDLCFEFNVEKAGYYTVTYRSSDDFDALFAETYENNVARNFADFLDNSYDDEYGTWYFSKIYYLEEGVSLLNVHNDYYGSSFEVNNTVSFKIEYFADSITDVRFKDEKDKYLFEDYDYIYSEGNTFEFYSEYIIEFSNKKTVEDHWVQCSFINELAKGENTVLMQLPGFEKEITIYYYETSDFVESIELGNIDNYLNAVEYYDGSYAFYNLYYDNEQVTVNLKDGTKQTFTYHDGDNYITLPCGIDLYVSIYHTSDDFDESGVEKPFLVARIGETRYIEKECNIEKVSFRRNFIELLDSIKGFLEGFAHCLRYNNEQLLNDGDIANWVNANIYEFKYYIPHIFNEISTFIRYYL